MKRSIKLSAYAKNKGVAYQTAWRWFRDGDIPGAFQTHSGTILVPLNQDNVRKDNIVIYARVSSSKQKNDLDNQVKRLQNYCTSKGYQDVKFYKEVASGLNDNRQQLNKILDDETITIIVIENRDRLTRFGYNYIERLLLKRNTLIEVANKQDLDKHDLVEDLVSVVYSMTARMYSKRRAKNTSDCIKNNLVVDDDKENK